MSIYKLANDAERERLRRFSSGCSETDLHLPMPAGWTVGALLAHLAFWDQRTALLLDRWIREDVTPPPDDEANIEWINDATKPLFLKIAGRDAAEFALLSWSNATRHSARRST